MIARLTGKLVDKQPHQVIIEAGGVGYRAFIPLSTFYTLPDEGAEVTLRTHTHLREDVIALYGFSSHDEQDLFERLIEISGIGPRLALAMLSGLSAGDLVDAILEGDAGRLRGIPGVGPKTADRVVLELRDRVGRNRGASATESPASGSRAGSSAIRRDVVSALVNLGYRESLAESAVRRALDGKQADGAALQEILKRSLRYLAS